MRQLIFIFLLLPFGHFTIAQNVGIGTATPETQLHVNNASGNSVIRSETNTPLSHSALELKTGAAPYDFLEIRKWIAGSGGTQAGVPLNGLSIITTGSNTTGGLLMGTKPAQPFYFTTDNQVRMQIDPLGNVRIGNSLAGNTRLFVTATSGSAVVGQTSFVPPVGSITSSILGNISNNSIRGSAVLGITQNAASSTAGIPAGMYGVVGGAIDEGYGVGAFGVAGAGGIYASVVGAGKALRTFGNIQLGGLGEGTDKVLTSDAAGNASWQIAPVTSHNHFGESWSGVNDLSGLVVINTSATTAAYGLLGASQGNFGTGVGGQSSNANGIGVSGIVFHAGLSLPTLEPNTGVHGLNSSGTGVYASSMSGYALKAIKQNWLSVAGPVALLRNEKTTNLSPVVLIENTATNPTALELNNGYLKVSGTNRMAFVHTTAATNIVGNVSTITYPNAASTDMLFVTHSYGPANTYFNFNYGVYWTGTAWSVYLETPATPMPPNINFNVMVIKQ